MTAPSFGIYVHIPFCVTVCPYCDFNVYTGLEHTAGAYVDAMLVEARARRDTDGPFPPAGSIFLGGGTPTLLDSALVARLLAGLRDVFTVDDDAEVTIEANPENVTVDLLSALRDAGVNRVSLGVQSFAPHVLATLGRAHSPQTAVTAVGSARRAGFDNISIDVIFGAPGETQDDWAATLQQALALKPEHISCYGLMIEQGTAFGTAVAAGRMSEPDEDEQAAKYELACDVIDLPHYEISNWGFKPSRHNLVYWTQGDYVGLGAGAHSHREGIRSWNHKRPATYMEHAADPTAGSEALTDAQRADEWLQLHLRLLEGVDLQEASRQMSRDLRPAAEELKAAGLAGIHDGRLILTRRGLLVENQVALSLMDAPSVANVAPTGQ